MHVYFVAANKTICAFSCSKSDLNEVECSGEVESLITGESLFIHLSPFEAETISLKTNFITEKTANLGLFILGRLGWRNKKKGTVPSVA